MNKEVEIVQELKEKFAEYKNQLNIAEALRKQAHDMQCKANVLHSDITRLKEELFKILDR